MSPVQLATSTSFPGQVRPLELGAGSSHLRLRLWVQSLPQTDQADHLDQPPSTTASRALALRFAGAFRGPRARRAPREAAIPPDPAYAVLHRMSGRQRPLTDCVRKHFHLLCYCESVHEIKSDEVLL